MAGKYGDPIRPGARNFVALRHEIPSGPTGRPPNTGVNTDCSTGHPRSEFRGTTPRNSGTPNLTCLTSSHSHDIRVRQRLATKSRKSGPNGTRRAAVKVRRRAAAGRAVAAGRAWRIRSCCVGDRETFNRADAGILRHEAAHPSDRPVFSLRARPLVAGGAIRI